MEARHYERHRQAKVIESRGGSNIRRWRKLKTKRKMKAGEDRKSLEYFIGFLSLLVLQPLFSSYSFSSFFYYYFVR